jgi:hypothetical protein
MAIRKLIAKQLSNASKVLEKDQSKERVGAAVIAARVALANTIMPKKFNYPTR